MKRHRPNAMLVKIARQRSDTGVYAMNTTHPMELSLGLCAMIAANKAMQRQYQAILVDNEQDYDSYAEQHPMVDDDETFYIDM